MLLFSLVLVATMPAARTNVRIDSTTQHGTVTGSVSADSSNVVLRGASVQVEDTPCTTTTDSAGLYILHNVPARDVQIRITATGFRPLEITVLVPAQGVLQVDAILTRGSDSTGHPAPIKLPEVRVIVTGNSSTSDLASTTPKAMSLGESWDVGQRLIAESQLQGDPDVIRALATTPTLGLSAGTTTLADRGGTREETLVTIDGIPLWNPYHGTTVVAAISPDAVSTATLDDGTSSAQYDGRLTGTLALHSTVPSPDSVHGSVAMSPAVVRAAFSAPVPLDSGVWLLTARHHMDLLPTLATNTDNLRGDWGDVFTSLRGVTAFGTIQLLGFVSNDRVSTNTNDDLTADSDPTNASAQSRWETQAIGLRWQRSFGSAVAEGQIWDSRYSARMQWPGDDTDDGPRTVANNAGDLGASEKLTWSGTLFGLSVEHMTTTYSSAQYTDDVLPGTLPFLRMNSTPTIASVFAERQWADSTAWWRLTTGLRSATVSSSRLSLEPRIAVAMTPLAGTWVTVGYARREQFVQALLNPESSIASSIGPDLLVATGTPGLPVAQSDEWQATITTVLHGAIRLRVDGYMRQLDNVVVVAPNSPAAMYQTQLTLGRGRANGVGVAIDHSSTASRLAWRFSSGVGQTLLNAAGVQYHPAFEQGTTGAFTAGYRLGPATWLRVGAFGAAGLDPTEFESSTTNESSEEDEDNDTRPARGNAFDESTFGVLTSGLARAPAATQLDLGIEHRWHKLNLFGGIGGIAAPSSWWTLMQRSEITLPPNHLQLRLGLQAGR